MLLLSQKGFSQNRIWGRENETQTATFYGMYIFFVFDTLFLFNLQSHLHNTGHLNANKVLTFIGNCKHSEHRVKRKRTSYVF